jgi:hypothetical protein
MEGGEFGEPWRCWFWHRLLLQWVQMNGAILQVGDVQIRVA